MCCKLSRSIFINRPIIGVSAEQLVGLVYPIHRLYQYKASCDQARRAGHGRHCVMTPAKDHFQKCSALRQWYVTKRVMQAQLQDGASVRISSPVITINHCRIRLNLDILEKRFVPFAPYIGPNVLVMKDNAQTQAAQVVQNYLLDSGIDSEA